jgi:hypothetical protein
MIYIGQKETAMSASKILALTSLFLPTALAQTEWKIQVQLRE